MRPDLEARSSDTRVSPTRRRMLAGAMAAAPVAMTLHSTSALATGVCVSPSAFASIRANPVTSNRPTTLNTCNSHGYWKNHDWPTGNGLRDAAFGSVFSAPHLLIGTFQNPSDPKKGQQAYLDQMTLFQAVWIGGDGGAQLDGNLARDMVSSYLDALAGNLVLRPGPAANTVAILQQMWASAIIANYWVTPWGDIWHREDARAWLSVLVGNASL